MHAAALVTGLNPANALKNKQTTHWASLRGAPAGVVPIAHDSAGPREDIVLPETSGVRMGDDDGLSRLRRGEERGRAEAKEQTITGYR
jgi:hypothetical protein